MYTYTKNQPPPSSLETLKEPAALSLLTGDLTKVEAFVKSFNPAKPLPNIIAIDLNDKSMFYYLSNGDRIHRTK